MIRQTAHIISHTHWDREWYMSFEQHRARLVKLMDELLDLLDRDSAFSSFHLDGQTVILEDYLKVRPEQRERLAARIREGRIHIGPWYILQDEFLTSGEANVRNLLYGHMDAAEYGAISKLGYFPDSFGNMGQAPQMMKQAGIETAVFGRGVTPTGFNNALDHSASYESPYSEMIWRSPDGSEVLGILFANWYSNGNEAPSEEAAAKAFWDRQLAAAGRFASTPHLLFMNGCDHQPVQQDLSSALATARRLYPDIDFVHSSFDEYVEAVRRHLPEQLKTVDGELRSQHTNGWGTLVNTASSRIYIKQANQLGQAMLEKVAEPLAVWASLTGAEYPHHLLRHAWKTLMHNHPHDSICGCSVDEVHREMMIRFSQSLQTAETVAADSAAHLAAAVDTASFARLYGESCIPVVAFNTTGWRRSGVVKVCVDVERIYFREGVSFPDMRERIKAVDIGGRILMDAAGHAVACRVNDLGLRFGYDLPDDKFRQPYFARTAELEFEAADVPALGYAAFAWARAGDASAPAPVSVAAPISAPVPVFVTAPTSAPVSVPVSVTVPTSPSEGAGGSPISGAEGQGMLARGERTLENRYLKVVIADDGTLDITDKASGRVYSGLGYYENTGDIGNEYMYMQPKNDQALTTRGMACRRIELVENTPYRASYELEHEWHIPCGADELLQTEREELVWFTQRQSGRSERTVALTIKTTVSLERNGKGVHIRTVFDNKATDHRIRMLFPTDVDSDVHYADSVFELAKRDNEPASEWMNPSNCQHQQALLSVHDGRGGLTIANKGLNEYEVLRDGRNTAAVTLLRAVGELGDWGVFPTPEAQCLGLQETELLLIPHAGGTEEARLNAYAEAYQFQTPWTVVPASVQQGRLPLRHSWLDWDGSRLAFSAMKRSEATGDIVLRWYNMTDTEECLCLTPPLETVRLHRSDILERRGDTIEAVGGSAELTVGKHEIITLSLSEQQRDI